MNRRKFLIGAGSLAAGSAAAMGTGAFSSVSAERSVTVDTADDSNALLALDAKSGNANSAYADESGDAISINVSDTNGNLSEDPAGVNTGAVTKIFDIFTVTNQGTQDVFVYVDPSSVTEEVKPDGDDDGTDEFGQEDGTVYIDPQGTDLPNANSGNTGPDGEVSLTGIYGGPGDPTNGFASSGAYDPVDLTLAPGDSFDFGLYVRANGEFPEDISFDIVADADLAGSI
jgi:hypothetical protein